MKKFKLIVCALIMVMTLSATACGSGNVAENEEIEEIEGTEKTESDSELETETESESMTETEEESETEPEEEENEGGDVSAAKEEYHNIIESVDGYGEGRIGDTMATHFFNYTINSAYLCDEFEGYYPAEGNRILVADATVKNTFKKSIEMYDTDFQVQWNSDEKDDYDFPITADSDPVSEEQLPKTYELGHL